MNRFQVAGQFGPIYRIARSVREVGPLEGREGGPVVGSPGDVAADGTGPVLVQLAQSGHGPLRRRLRDS